MANDDKGEIRTILPFTPSTIETIDFATYDWLDKEMDVFCTTNKGFKKVPVLWVAGERAHQVKNDKDLRDDNGALIFPMITLKRDGMVKDPARKGMFYGNIDPKAANPVNQFKGGSIEIARRIQQDKTAGFKNAYSARKDNKTVGSGQKGINFPSKKLDPKPVYEIISIPMPVYVDVTYTIDIRTEYQQQINEIIQPFLTKTDGINYEVIEKHKHQYELFIQQDFTENNTITEIAEESRIYHTSFQLKVLGHLVGGDKNQESPKVVIRETAVDVKKPRERTIMDDELPWIHGKLPR
tara:strand:+ start:1118 stop:2005 length:888 start_codon:yes stop_codon:yes gene_type:complete